MSRKRKRLGVIGIAVVAALAISAVMASAASASTPANVTWYVGGTAVPAGTQVPVGCEGGPWTFTSTIAGAFPVKITATGVNCVESYIENSAAGSEMRATDGGKLEFTGITVDEPEGCEINHPLTTNLLHTELVNRTGSTHAFDKFSPVNAQNDFIDIEFEGANCLFAGTQVPVEGFDEGEGNVFGTPSVKQALAFSAAIGSGLTFGGEPALITGTANNFLTGANAGKTFEAK